MERISLFNYEFDNSYLGTRFFSSIQERNQYFNIPNCFTNKPYVNFSFTSLDKASYYIREEEEDFRNLLESNYLIVESKKNKTDNNPKYYFYFIVATKTDSSHQVRLDLELDILQTHLLEVGFEKCLIENAHINRFVSQGNNYKFNLNKDSLIFGSEKIIDYDKNYSPVKKEYIYTRNTQDIDLNDRIIYDWCKENVIAWVYVFLSNNNYSESGFTKIKYNFYRYYDNQIVSFQDYFYIFKSSKEGEYGGEYGVYSQPYSVLCFPLYKPNNKKIKQKLGNEYIEMGDILKGFSDINLGYSYVLGIKLSHNIPTALFSYDIYTHIDSDNNLILEDDWYDEKKEKIFADVELPNVRYLTSLCLTYDTSKKYDFLNDFIPSNFTKNQIKSDKYKYEPKLYSHYFKIGKLSLGNCENVDLDLLTIGYTHSLQIKESIQPESVSCGLKLYNSDSFDFNSKENNILPNYFLNTYENLPFGNSKYDEFIANNNAYIDNANISLLGKLGIGSASGLFGIGLTAFGGARGKMAGAGMFVSGLLTTISSITNYTETLNTLNSKKNAPLNYTGGSTSVFTNFTFSNYFPNITKWECDEIIKKQWGDYFNEFGYSINIIDSPSNYFTGRKYFNYLKCEIKGIYSNEFIDNNTKKKLREIFSNGIKLYHCDLSEVGDNNYESYLDN